VFVGHLAVALAAKRVSPRTPLAALVAAAFGLDLLWPVFLLIGLERVRIAPGITAFTPLDFEHYPWSHSLSMAVIWAVAAGRLYVLRSRHVATAGVIGLVVVSHWLLDVVAHRPDLPLWPGGPLFGLGLWNSIPATFAVEGALFAAAIAAYLAGTRARTRAGSWAFWSLVAFTTLIWASGPFAPPPPSASAIAIVGLAMLLFPLWAHWIDRHRTTIR
jgi:hypothetical protein